SARPVHPLQTARSPIYGPIRRTKTVVRAGESMVVDRMLNCQAPPGEVASAKRADCLRGSGQPGEQQRARAGHQQLDDDPDGEEVIVEHLSDRNARPCALGYLEDAEGAYLHAAMRHARCGKLMRREELPARPDRKCRTTNAS